ncbi:DrmB family protein [Streptomyces sp. NPDC058953]|uniref:DrmB family protein n=1 Tax=unclassified Streptomyces TaxID=2593676 RepID=UPI0036A8B44C
MTPPPPRRRRGGPPERSFPRRGAVRRSQMITTYGVGSLVAVDNESFVVAGLDSWNVDGAIVIDEVRLARALGVYSFRLPPASDETSRDGVRVRRFPLWHSCQSCESLGHVRSFNSTPGRNECGECREDLVPSRFVTACSRGHLDDFPYWKWAHRGNRREGESGLCGGEMRLRTTGRTASLRSILVSCTCGIPEVSLEGAFRRRALTELGVRCEGRRPWLKGASPEECPEVPRTLQRGSSLVWQPVLRSALSIPPYSNKTVGRLCEDDWPQLRQLRTRAEFEIYARAVGARGKGPVSVDTLMALAAAESAEGTGGTEERTKRPESPGVLLRRQEYERLVAGHPESEADHGEEFVCEPPTSEASALRPFGVIDPMLVKRLREVRVLKAFSRVEDIETNVDVHEAALSLTPVNWLPAMEVLGEGVFLRLDRRRLDEWARGPAVASRVERIRSNHVRRMREFARDDTLVPDSPADPGMVLLHTLAHVLINEWSLDGGYPAAALRERLYADETMAGLLIHTSTNDSAGSLGGLVAQGEPERLVRSLRSALGRAEWCSADPLCIESEAAGAGSVNLAACHACVLLPETSCEHSNGLLDRALLVGTPEDPSIGFFGSHVAR